MMIFSGLRVFMSVLSLPDFSCLLELEVRVAFGGALEGF